MRDILFSKDEVMEAIKPLDTYFVREQYHDEVVAAKDARIAELEKRLAGPREAGCCYIVDKAEYDAMKARLALLEQCVTTWNQESHSNESSIVTAKAVAKLAKQMLGQGKHIPFAAACCISLVRELESAEKQIEELRSAAERHSVEYTISRAAVNCALDRLKEAAKFKEAVKFLKSSAE